MTVHYYDPWKLGMLTESITIAITPIEKLDKSKEYVVTTNGLLAEQYDLTEQDTEIDWAEFHKKHHDHALTEEVKPTDSIFMWAEGEEANKDWKWCKYGAHESTARGISDDEFIRRIQHEGKVLVVTSVSTGIRKYFSNGEVEKIEDNRWEMNDHDDAPACPKKAPKKYRVVLVDIFGLHDLDEDND